MSWIRRRCAARNDSPEQGKTSYTTESTRALYALWNRRLQVTVASCRRRCCSRMASTLPQRATRHLMERASRGRPEDCFGADRESVCRCSGPGPGDSAAVFTEALDGEIWVGPEWRPRRHRIRWERVAPTSQSVLYRSQGRLRLLSHLASDEALSGPGVDNASGIDLLTLSFVAIVDAMPLDDRPVAI